MIYSYLGGVGMKPKRVGKKRKLDSDDTGITTFSSQFAKWHIIPVPYYLGVPEKKEKLDTGNLKLSLKKFLPTKHWVFVVNVRT